MPFQKFLLPAASVVFVVLAYRTAGWAGVGIASGALLMWLLLHFTRMMQVLKRSAKRPVGHVGSAVMLHAKLKPGMTLLHVVAMTGSLGERISEQGIQPERYCWRDGGESFVHCDFLQGKLKIWSLTRPEPT
jgi:hypothetical protein